MGLEKRLRIIGSVQPKATLALGSNMGDRAHFLSRACEMLDSRDLRVLRRSSLYVTRPTEGTPGGPFMNAVVFIETQLRPRALLHRCQRIEHELGRIRRERWGPRTIDIDIIFYGNLEISRPGLTIPHPRWSERDFVLVPLIELGYAPARLEARKSTGVGLPGKQVERHILRKQNWPGRKKSGRAPKL